MRQFKIAMCMAVLTIFVSSCSQNPTFEDGAYAYENGKLYPIKEHVNDMVILWQASANGTQREVIRNIIKNMVRVQGGDFAMGAQSQNSASGNFDPAAQSDESPVHRVTLSSFYIDKYVITQKEWMAIMGPRTWEYNADNSEEIPAYSVSYDDVEAFINKLNALSNIKFALPTEAQWEFAARGGIATHGYYYSGSNNVDEVAWTKNNAGGKVHAVGQKLPNELGLYDMSGGVWEWCRDEYSLYGSAAQNDPGSKANNYAVLRGGAWDYMPSYCRVSTRDMYNIKAQSFSNGFRLVAIPF